MSKTINIFAGLCLIFFGACKQETVKTSGEKTSKQTPHQTLPDNVSPEKKVYSKYVGAWFSIEYPSTFTAKPSLPSPTRKDGFDSVIFTSPDGSVQFYVFSPQWSGVAGDIGIKAGESQTASSSETKNGLHVKRWTLKADDGSYSRSYESTSETVSNINKVFGIQYRSQKDLDAYKEEYLHFKNSLEQYAD